MGRTIIVVDAEAVGVSMSSIHADNDGRVATYPFIEGGVQVWSEPVDLVRLQVSGR